MTQPKISLYEYFPEVTEEDAAKIRNKLSRLKREYGITESEMDRLKTSARKLVVRNEIENDRYRVEECGNETREDLLKGFTSEAPAIDDRLAETIQNDQGRNRGEFWIMKNVRYVPKAEALEARARFEHIRKKYGLSSDETEMLLSGCTKLWFRQLLNDGDANIQTLGEAETIDEILE